MPNYRARLGTLIGAEAVAHVESSFAGFETRSYQVLVLEKLLRVARAGENPLLILDPGLGKTFVSQALFLALQRRDSSRWTRCLVLAPSRLLRDQHLRAAWRLRPLLRPTMVDHACAGRPCLLRTSVERSNWVVTTPKLIANAMSRDYRLRRLIRETSFCVVDEFDAQAAEDTDWFGEPIGRLSQAAGGLVRELKVSGVPFLCMSATRRDTSSAWLDEFDLREVTVSSKSIGQYRAFAKVIPVRIDDPVVSLWDSELDLVVKDTLRKVRERVTGEFTLDPGIDPASFGRQAAQVLRGQRTHLYLKGDLNVNVSIKGDGILVALLGRYMEAQAFRLSLYEGRLLSVAVARCERFAQVEPGSDKLVPVDSVTGVSYVTGPHNTGKTEFLAGLLEARGGEQALILPRFVDINEHISKVLEARGHSVSSMHGQKSDSNNREELDRFLKALSSVLVVNRQMGGRGFDLPSARFACFLSPKRSEETMWQEMLRIRSTVSRPKDVYVLYYGATREESKLDALVSDIGGHPDRYELVT